MGLSWTPLVLKRFVSVLHFCSPFHFPCTAPTALSLSRWIFRFVSRFWSSHSSTSTLLYRFCRHQSFYAVFAVFFSSHSHSSLHSCCHRNGIPLLYTIVSASTSRLAIGPLLLPIIPSSFVLRSVLFIASFFEPFEGYARCRSPPCLPLARSSPSSPFDRPCGYGILSRPTYCWPLWSWPLPLPFFPVHFCFHVLPTTPRRLLPSARTRLFPFTNFAALTSALSS